MASRSRPIQPPRDLLAPVSRYLPIKLIDQIDPSSRLAFFKAQVDEGTITDAATCVKINVSKRSLFP
jgi:hypothetical protein